jgi:hypothetical protein
VGPADLKEFWVSVQSNHDRLEGCYGPHDFVAKVGDYPYLNSPFVCLKCKGEVSWDTQHWYRLGLKHGGRAA